MTTNITIASDTTSTVAGDLTITGPGGYVSLGSGATLNVGGSIGDVNAGNFITGGSNTTVSVGNNISLTNQEDSVVLGDGGKILVGGNLDESTGGANYEGVIQVGSGGVISVGGELTLGSTQLSVGNGGTLSAGSLSMNATGSVGLGNGAHATIGNMYMGFSQDDINMGNGATLTITGTVTNAQVISNNMDTVNNYVNFAGAGGGATVLYTSETIQQAAVSGGTNFTGVSGFHAGDVVGFESPTDYSGAALTVSVYLDDEIGVFANNTLVSDLYDFNIVSGYTPSASYANGILYIGCFLAGTSIGTPAGGVAVEDLREGDLLLTASGEAKPVRWIGHRRVTTADAGDPNLHAPVCIQKDALAPGKPQRDLWLTPDHAILAQGKLIPVKLLVNGTTIRSVPRSDYTFYHVELDRHALLQAEGLEAESYLDVLDTRQRFDNNPVTQLRHDAELTAFTEQVYAERGCLPLSLSAEAVHPVWQAIADRAPQAGEADVVWSTDPALHVSVAGMKLKPVAVEGNVYVFDLPRMATDVVIGSKAASPWQRRPWIDDRRMLGVAICGIAYMTSADRHDVALDGEALGAGWHAVETSESGEMSYRWTNGAAKLRLPVGAVRLALTLNGFGEYPEDMRQRAEARVSMA